MKRIRFECMSNKMHSSRKRIILSPPPVPAGFPVISLHCRERQAFCNLIRRVAAWKIFYFNFIATRVRAHAQIHKLPYPRYISCIWNSHDFLHRKAHRKMIYPRLFPSFFSSLAPSTAEFSRALG